MALDATTGPRLQRWERFQTKVLNDMSSKWQQVNNAKHFNALEKAFKDARAKVAKETEEGTLVGTVTSYNMDATTREGTWIITWQDGTTEEVKKEGLITALDVFDASPLSVRKDITADEQQVVAVAAAGSAPNTRKPRAEMNKWSKEEMMTLYRLRHGIGSNDWAGIAASGKIPNKSASEMSRKWKRVQQSQEVQSSRKGLQRCQGQSSKADWRRNAYWNCHRLRHGH